MDRTDEVIKINGALITAQPQLRQLPTNFCRHTTCKGSTPSVTQEIKTLTLQNHLLGPCPTEQPTAASAIDRHKITYYNKIMSA